MKLRTFRISARFRLTCIGEAACRPCDREGLHVVKSMLQHHFQRRNSALSTRVVESEALRCVQSWAPRTVGEAFDSWRAATKSTDSCSAETQIRDMPHVPRPWLLQLVCRAIVPCLRSQTHWLVEAVFLAIRLASCLQILPIASGRKLIITTTHGPLLAMACQR